MAVLQTRSSLSYRQGAEAHRSEMNGSSYGVLEIGFQSLMPICRLHRLQGSMYSSGKERHLNWEPMCNSSLGQTVSRREEETVLPLLWARKQSHYSQPFM